MCECKPGGDDDIRPVVLDNVHHRLRILRLDRTRAFEELPREPDRGFPMGHLDIQSDRIRCQQLR